MILHERWFFLDVHTIQVGLYITLPVLSPSLDLDYLVLLQVLTFLIILVWLYFPVTGASSPNIYVYWRFLFFFFLNLYLWASTLSLFTEIFFSFTGVFKLLFILMISIYEAFRVNQGCAFGVMRYKRGLVETSLIFSYVSLLFRHLILIMQSQYITQQHWTKALQLKTILLW